MWRSGLLVSGKESAFVCLTISEVPCKVEIVLSIHKMTSLKKTLGSNTNCMVDIRTFVSISGYDGNTALSVIGEHVHPLISAIGTRKTCKNSEIWTTIRKSHLDARCDAICHEVTYCEGYDSKTILDHVAQLANLLGTTYIPPPRMSLQTRETSEVKTIH